MQLSRRNFVIGAASTATLIPLSYALRVSFGDYVYPKTFRYLTAKEAVVCAALAETIIPEDNEYGITHEQAQTLEGLDEFFSVLSPLERADFRLLIWTTEHVLPALGGHFRRFTKLTVEERTELLEVLSRGSHHLSNLLLRALKSLVAFPYFNSPIVQEKLGVKGWCGP